MAATEAQKAGLAKARANLAAKRAAAKALASQEQRPEIAAAYRDNVHLHDPTGEAAVMEAEAPCLDPEIAGLVPLTPVALPGALEAAAIKMLKTAEVRRGDGTAMLDRCLLCDDMFDSAVIHGVHHTDPIRCECACHELREALKAVA